MISDELRMIMDFLRQKVHLKGRGSDGEVVITFDAPTADEMARAGLNLDGYRQVLDALGEIR